MCIGMPLRVIEAWPGGARVAGRGRCERIDTRLVGERVAVGQWLLVFQGAARECLDDARAAEIHAALDLLDAALAGDSGRAAGSDPGFALPSAWSAEQLAAFAGQPVTRPSGDPT